MDNDKYFIELTEYLDTQWDHGDRSAEIIIGLMLRQIWSKLDDIRYLVENIKD